MYIIIPAYEPDERLVAVVRDVKQELNAEVIVVNDGSGKEYHSYYHMSEKLGAVVLEHDVNKGKGAALKTAFDYILDHSEERECETVVTVDSDGQHLIKDIIKVAHQVQNYPNSIVLGARAFVGKVPFRSRFGNKVTALLFKLVTGEPVTDTQTGLRGMTTDLLPWLLTLEGERFEYEFNMLLEASKAGYHLVEEPIATVYLEENKSSHFRPIQDSVRIYAPFLKFIASASAAALLDAAMFFILMSLTNHLLLSVIIARIISASLQCFLNATAVFKSRKNPIQGIVRYGVLVCVILMFNYLLITGLVSLGIAITIAKFLTELVLFLFSYRVQKTIVFA